MQFWSLEVKPGQTRYMPTRAIKLRGVTSVNPGQAPDTSRAISLKVSTPSTQVAICTLTPQINHAAVDLFFMEGTPLLFEVVGGGVLVLSGSEFKTTHNVPPADAWQMSPVVRKKVLELEYVDHARGTGLTVGSTSTVAFRYIIRRIIDNVIIQRNDGSPRPAVVNLEDQKDSAMSGLTQTMIGMQEGGERHAKVPARLGKGSTPVSGLEDDDDFFLYLRVEAVLTNPAE